MRARLLTNCPTSEAWGVACTVKAALEPAAMPLALLRVHLRVCPAAVSLNTVQAAPAADW